MEALLFRTFAPLQGDFSRSLGLRLLSLASLVLVWLALSWLLGSAVVPGPVETVLFLIREHERGQLELHVGITLWRVLLSFVIAMALGALIGVAVGVSRTLDRLLEAWVLTGLAVPRILPLVVCYLLIGLNDTAAIVALVMILVPQVVVQSAGRDAIYHGKRRRANRVSARDGVIRPAVVGKLIGWLQGMLPLPGALAMALGLLLATLVGILLISLVGLILCRLVPQFLQRSLPSRLLALVPALATGLLTLTLAFSVLAAAPLPFLAESSVRQSFWGATLVPV
ncbi:MAG: hypothetical protein K6T35_01245, partial [Meiothermus silvanus]|nr:hypothetical protein [Allomeiothermus silvanus]